MALLLALWIGACAGERSGEAEGRGGAGGAAQLSLRVEPGVVGPRGPVTAVLGLRNGSDTAITLRFATAQRYDFSVIDSAGTVVWRWSANRTFAQAAGEQTVPPGWEVNYEERFAAPSGRGPYRVVATVSAVGNLGSAVANLTVR